MSSGSEIEMLEAQARHLRDRAALLRAKLYRQGVGSNRRLEELERELDRAEQLVRARRRSAAQLAGGTEAPAKPA